MTSSGEAEIDDGIKATNKEDTISSEDSFIIGEKGLSKSEVTHETDTCYSWIVLIACFFTAFVSQIPLTVSGILYLEFLDTFYGQENLILWASSLAANLSFLFTPLAALFAEWRSPRTSSLVGSIGLGLSLGMLSLTTNMTLFFILYGVLPAMFSALIYVPAYTFATRHFTKYREIVLMLSTVGSTLSFLVMPPLVTYMIKLSSWREANMCLAYICLQGSVFAALMREPASCPQVCEDPVSERRSGCAEEKSISEEYVYSKERALPINESSNCQTWLAGTRPLLHWRMLLIMSISIIYGWNAGMYFVVMPSHVKHFGVTLEETAYIFMIGACVNLSTRVLCALLGRFFDYDKTKAILGGALLGAVSMVGYAFFTKYFGFAVCCVLYGVSLGILGSLHMPVILEMHGEYRVELVFGFGMMLYGVAAISAPLIAGGIERILGSASAGFGLSAGLSIAASLSLLPHLIIKYSSMKIKQKHNHR